MNNIACGIDFGTSNSAVAIGNKEKIELVRVEGNNTTIPTAVFFNVEENRKSYGRQAVSEYLDGYTGRLMRSLKSILGSELIYESTQIGRERVDFAQIIGMFIKHIKNISETQATTTIENVVLGRPVFFVDGDNNADKRAENELRSIALSQGFKNISFEFEPIAAARDYESTLSHEELVLVVDIGGGTSDFSLIKLSPLLHTKEDRSTDILGNSGVHIGGTDFDKKFSLLNIMPHLGYKTLLKNGLNMPLSPYHTLATWHLINSLYAPNGKSLIKELHKDAQQKDLLNRLVNIIEHQKGHELANTVEDAKITLSNTDATNINLGFIEDNWDMNLSQNDLIIAAHDDIEKIINVAAKMATNDAGIKNSDINTIFMTGGSTGLPSFAQKIQTAFPNAKIMMGDRFSSVVKGLGISATRRYA